MIRACEQLGVRRLAVITPYVDAVTERLLAFLAEFDLIGPLETSVRRPVLTANQVTMWAALDMAGHPENPWSRWLPSIHA